MLVTHALWYNVNINASDVLDVFAISWIVYQNYIYTFYKNKLFKKDVAEIGKIILTFLRLGSSKTKIKITMICISFKNLVTEEWPEHPEVVESGLICCAYSLFAAPACCLRFKPGSFSTTFNPYDVLKKFDKIYDYTRFIVAHLYYTGILTQSTLISQRILISHSASSYYRHPRVTQRTAL